LGDIVHQAVPVTEVVGEFRALVAALNEQCGTELILGNHDKDLRRLAGGEFRFSTELRVGGFLLLHGNASAELGETSFAIIGHEHPAISIGDGIMGRKFPCFLASESLLILPAFSLWAAGSDIRTHSFMSPLANRAKFHSAVAICGTKLLPLPLCD
jgi:putative SbcD/Mre11-related phosphoesterase